MTDEKAEKPADDDATKALEQERLESLAHKYNGLGNGGDGDPIKDWP